MPKHNPPSDPESGATNEDARSAQKRLIESALEVRALSGSTTTDESFLTRVNSSIDEIEDSSSTGRKRRLRGLVLPLGIIGLAALLLVPSLFVTTEKAGLNQSSKQFAITETPLAKNLPENLSPRRESVTTTRSKPAVTGAPSAPTNAADILTVASTSAANIPTTPTPQLKKDFDPPALALPSSSPKVSRNGTTRAKPRRRIVLSEARKPNAERPKEISITEAEREPQNDGFLAKGPKSSNPNQNDVFYGGVSLGGKRVVATRRYDRLIENPWYDPLDKPLSTFSIDVDTASFTHVRNLINDGHGLRNIHKDAVRIEEWINYYDWNYPEPKGNAPFSTIVETAHCPWAPRHQLVKIGIQGKHVSREQRPRSNLVFLVDVSGSMSSPNKIGLVKKSLAILAEEMKEDDRIAIVVYAGSEGLALESTSGNDQEKIQAAIGKISSGGSTNGGAGIQLAYKVAEEHFLKGGINRVILCTDGDFNVGLTGKGDLVQLIEEKSAGNIFLSIAGFGTDNLNDGMLEAISNRGNGNYFFIDSLEEARKVFLSDLSSTLVTIAKDVKIQVEFNPGQVDGYRLIGYNNRILAAEDFDNDAIDAGEIGAGHRVTALYEVIPLGTAAELRYQKEEKRSPKKLIASKELGWLKLRYKEPTGTVSKLIEQAMMPTDQSWEQASDDFRFASAVALLGMKLRGHKSAEGQSLAAIAELAKSGHGPDPMGRRAELSHLIKKLESQDNGAKPGETIRFQGGVEF